MKSYTLLSVVIFGLWLARAHEIHVPLDQRSLSPSNDSEHHNIRERSLIGGSIKIKDVLGLAGLLPKKIKAAPQMVLVGIVDQPVPSPVPVPMPRRPALPPRPAYPPQQPAYPQPSYQPPQQPAYPQPSYQPPQQPAYPQPSYQPPQQPAYPQPSYQPPQQPAYPQPSYQPPQQPAYQQPSYQQPQTQSAYSAPAAPTAYPPAAGTAKTQVVPDSSNSTTTDKQVNDADALRFGAFDSNSLTGQSDPTFDAV